jgi:hypothetical protein
MLRVLHDDRALAVQALACLDEALRAGRLDPDRRELQVIALPSGGRLLVGWRGRLAIAALRRPEPDCVPLEDPTEGEVVVAAFKSYQSGRRNLAAFMIRLLVLQFGATVSAET